MDSFANACLSLSDFRYSLVDLPDRFDIKRTAKTPNFDCWHLAYVMSHIWIWWRRHEMRRRRAAQIVSQNVYHRVNCQHFNAILISSYFLARKFGICGGNCASLSLAVKWSVLAWCIATFEDWRLCNDAYMVAISQMAHAYQPHENGVLLVWVQIPSGCALEQRQTNYGQYSYANSGMLKYCSPHSASRWMVRAWKMITSNSTP